MAKLNARQERFCEEYLIDLNATQAAIRAGYSVKTAYSIGHELLSKPEIRTRVEKDMAERSKRTGINQDRIIRELARIALVDPTELVDMEDGRLRETATEDDRAAIASVKVKKMSGLDVESVEREVRFADKLKALELLGKHFGMYTDKLDINIPVTVVIEDDYGDDD